jgi:hypothetical protein
MLAELVNGGLASRLRERVRAGARSTSLDSLSCGFCTNATPRAHGPRARGAPGDAVEPMTRVGLAALALPAGATRTRKRCAKSVMRSLRRVVPFQARRHTDAVRLRGGAYGWRND